MNTRYIINHIDTEAGKIPQVSSVLNSTDKWESFKVCLAISRMHHVIAPGIYAVGNPGKDSVVLVSANYKLSFDILRKEINGLDAWILVLDTKGINVWCAAGKGTFSTGEIVNRVRLSALEKIVNHRSLIVPQLGAPGVSAHEVKKQSGFSIIYGPVRASDIQPFIQNGMKASPQMRQVTFSFVNRLILVPVEIVLSLKYLFVVSAAFFLLSMLTSGGYGVITAGAHSVINVLGAYLAGTVLGPLLLPWLPGRSFALKGFFSGIIVFSLLSYYNMTGSNFIEMIAWMMIIPAISSYLTMNFTGASTYTSLSGVLKEMRFAIPLQIIFAVTGTVMWITSRFVS